MDLNRRRFVKGFVAACVGLAVTPRLMGPVAPGPMTEATKSRIISKYISTAAGRGGLARSMVMPIRRRLDYAGIGRKAFVVESLPSGSLPVYDRKPDVSGENSQRVDIDAYMRGRKVVVEPAQPAQRGGVMGTISRLLG